MSFEKQMNLLPVFLLIDTSGSMSGTKIEQVKTAIEEIKLQLSLLNEELVDADLNISILSFDSECKWLAKFKKPREIKSDLAVGGITNMGCALSELNQALTKGNLAAENNNYDLIKCPVVIMLTDGCATDDFDASLEIIKTNRWFLQSYRLAFAIGEDADIECMVKFTGSEKNVLSINDVSVISEILPKVTRSLSAASGYSKNANYKINNYNEQFVESAKKTEQAIFDAIEDRYKADYNHKTFRKDTDYVSGNNLEWNSDNFNGWE